jgi:ORC complex protein Cdc6/Orc1
MCVLSGNSGNAGGGGFKWVPNTVVFMSDRVFARGDTPFRNRDALSDLYTPTELVGRDEELTQYKNYLEPVVWGEDPNNVFLYGKTGVGKTAATKYLISALESDVAEYDDTRVESVQINCDGLSTSYRVAVAVVNAIRDPHDQISESGYSTSEVYRMMWHELDNLASETPPDQTTIVLLVLDEIDHTEVGEDSILYQLSRAQENDNLERTRIGVIGISNDLTFSDQLSPKVKSSLCQKKIFFETYDAEELHAVLEQRASVAFKDGALEPGVIGLCAAYGRKQSGDAREAIDLLRAAGDIARNDDREVVTETDVDEGQARVERENIVEGVRSLHEHSRYTLYALSTLAAEGEAPARTRGIHRRYEVICDLAAATPLTLRRVRDFLRELEMLGAVDIKEQNRGPRGGQYLETELGHPIGVMVTALDDTIEKLGAHDSIAEHVPE